MHKALVACVPVLLVLTACVHDSNTSRPSAAAAPTPAAAPPATTTTPDMPAPVPSAPAPPAEAPTAVPSAAPAAGAPTGTEAAAAGAATAAPAVRSGSTPGKPAKAPASGAPPAAAGPAVPSTTPAAPPQPAASAAALDLNGLEQRLRDTRAIGVFTKLTLKNQVDDLLGKFKSFHQGQSRVTLAQLRQQYEVLLLKVISLLQDDDPSLASAVSSSRETIWGVLTDPKKFANI